jgi:hypothetical protein
MAIFLHITLVAEYVIIGFYLTSRMGSYKIYPSDRVKIDKEE